ncbi:PucR family transcriptional regulator [Heyndrickxia acidicola]|uniref:Helix-turn-helix domain-containing protein n=1 Tax=Heyndrickxia acidicola TaxID=209389 RepID=A0ABU6MDM9_9BACI|nr:helix-turn-helix domain-containing protein [Heyndrickxia acidicola]MED1202409.1 helix-turn-helix domain-containing protein [Heyndrickxia acidicola]
MITQLQKRYPKSILETYPVLHPGITWFHIENEHQYLGIPDSDMTSEEKELLGTLFPIFKAEKLINPTTESQNWHNFLSGKNVEFPVKEGSRLRFIQFAIHSTKEGFDRIAWEEAVKSLFSNNVTLVYLSSSSGTIIETAASFVLSEEELKSSIEAFESDFYFTVHFFIGPFRDLDNQIQNDFLFEKKLFEFGRREMRKERLYTLSSIFPLYLLKSVSYKAKESCFSPLTSIFQEDKDIWRTIKLYIENNSNASLTAKQLFMHRNSLQYRIDKFTERTGFDLKSFKDAVTVYLACLDFKNEHQL